jgi:hypothetical protein
MVPRTSYALEARDTCNTWLDDTRATNASRSACQMQLWCANVTQMLCECHANVTRMPREWYANSQSPRYLQLPLIVAGPLAIRGLLRWVLLWLPYARDHRMATGLSLHVGLICGMVCNKISGQPQNSLPSNAFLRLGSLGNTFEK